MEGIRNLQRGWKMGLVAEGINLKNQIIRTQEPRSQLEKWKTLQGCQIISDIHSTTSNLRLNIGLVSTRLPYKANEFLKGF